MYVVSVRVRGCACVRIGTGGDCPLHVKIFFFSSRECTLLTATDTMWGRGRSSSAERFVTDTEVARVIRGQIDEVSYSPLGRLLGSGGSDVDCGCSVRCLCGSPSSERFVTDTVVPLKDLS